MRKFFGKVVPWTIILSPFVILALRYAALPAQVMIFRGLGSAPPEYAPKSLFSVFRVPLIEVVCGLAIEVMRRRSAELSAEKQASYYLMWTILLYTVAMKTLLQTLEQVSSGTIATASLYATIAIVVAGIVSAAIPGRRVFARAVRAEWKIRPGEIVALASLLLAYVVLAFNPLKF
jgi:uncharacterized membrane protein